jgi:hypothetical protein
MAMVPVINIKTPTTMMARNARTLLIPMLTSVRS